MYNIFSRFVLSHHLSDLQCGFKAGSRQLFQAIVPHVKNGEWFFDTELVVLALRSGARVKEVPVSWQENRYEERTSKVNIVRDSIRFALNLVLLRARLIREAHRGFIHRHAPLFLMALLVGALYAAPYAYFAYTPRYQGIFIAQAPDEVFYMSTINKSYQSSSLVGNPYLYEYQSVRNPFQYYAVEYALGKTGAFLHLRIDQLATAMEFVFPLLLTLALYWLALLISKSRASALMASAGMMLANEMARPGIADTLNTFLFKSPWTSFMLYERPVNPQVSGIFFYLVLISLFFLYRNPKSKAAVVISGIGLGLLAYIYFYFWAFCLMAFGVVWLYALVVRRWPLLVATTVAGCIGTVVSLPFLVAAGSTFLHGVGGTLAQAVPTHEVIIEKMVLVPLFLYVCIALWAWWSKGTGRAGAWASAFSNKYTFVLILLITGVIASNQQVLTGKLLQQQHFHFFTNIPLFLLAVTLLLGEVVLLLPRTARVAACSAVLVIFFWFGAGEQFSSYQAFAGNYARYQQLAPVFTWLDEHAQPQVVVLGDQQNSSWVPIYTQDFVYNSIYDSNYQVPQSRIVHDYFVDLALQGVTAQSVRAYVYNPDNRNEIGYILFGGLYYRDLCGSAGCFPDSVLQNLITEYTSFLSHPLLQNIQQHKVDYMLIDNVADAGWKLRGIAGKPVITSGDFTLYSLQ